MIHQLKDIIEGEYYDSQLYRTIYSTDASAYKEYPDAIVIPKNKKDIQNVIKFAKENKTPIIPRAAGTSLAGQVVGKGIILDLSKYMTRILELNVEEKWVRVEPGVILDELNKYLSTKSLYFGPEASTANRCNIGGMLGNNACGLHSLIYGSTRDHTIEVETILSDGSKVIFKETDKTEFEEKCNLKNLEGEIYRNIKTILSNPDNIKTIKNEYPDSEIKRRNTGYAIDLLIDNELFSNSSNKFNFCKLLAGSEGTLAIVTEIKLKLVELPPKEKAVLCVHFNSLNEALKANLIALQFKPSAIELMDKTILDCTKGNIKQNKNRFFIDGDPAAILIIELNSDNRDEIEDRANLIEQRMRKSGMGYAFPIVFGNDTKKVWNLRKAGLGVLSNVPGDAKPVSVVEDTSISVDKLPQYIEEFTNMLDKYNLNCVYHAHIGTGELHLRPILDLKKQKDRKLFYTVAEETAVLVKKYNGSLSGEHGDGRLRGQFIPLMIGEKNYDLLRLIKKTWDPDNIFNPGKIVDTPKMNTHLRYTENQKVKEFETMFDFSNVGGIVRAVEKCNGSGDCRKSEIIGGTLCPSYMATRDEKNTTRARANTLREIISYSDRKNPFDHPDLYEVMDLCLSCKACKSECPSGVDVAKLKAEFLYQYYQSHRIPLRTKMIANIVKINKLASLIPSISNFFMQGKHLGGILMKLFRFSPKRRMPAYHKTTLKKWIKKNIQNNEFPRKVYLFNDEFTNYNDTEIGIKTILLLNKLGYDVKIPHHKASGRTYLSKGLLAQAKKLAKENVQLLKNIINEETPLIGIEPSAILAFRDEYPDLVGESLKQDAEKLAKYAFTIEEFLATEIDNKSIDKNKFTKEYHTIKYHGHCQQKAVASTQQALKIMSFPENYKVEEIPSGCCGMAGSFGFEKEHYDVSMKVGELILFPEVRRTDAHTIISASGTSCRHQIHDGTGRKALHPVEVLYDALI